MPESNMMLNVNDCAFHNEKLNASWWTLFIMKC